ncbi:hypothetical protein CFN78_23710 [Amycolatopsis antarctica]|uniref:Uncharacterized protein n=1 Tax=Amycolatopsis antarctica TaxID=1854586 RepID=A0A263CX14_9PSEU|nr:hypothetical protein CFN78_23710 [Amycolatopsis antarctica]
MVALLAGLVLTVGLHCAGGMAGMSAMPSGSAVAPIDMTLHTSAQVSATAGSDGPAMPAAPTPRASGVGVATVSASDIPADHGWGGALAACLVVFLGIVAAVVKWRPRRIGRLVLSMNRADRWPSRPAVVPRAPSLAQLCLLRT